MNRLLQLSTYGIKNIENSIVIDFSNATIKNANKINNVKGIFGYNGAGKSALITAVDFYKSIVSDSNFLLQNDTKKQLEKLINYKKNEFFISMIFEFEKDIVIKHSLLIGNNLINNDYSIREERIELSAGRTLNEKFKDLVVKIGNVVKVDDDYKEDAGYLFNSDLTYQSLLQPVIKKIIEKSTEKKLNANPFEKKILILFTSIIKIDVYLQLSDKHKKYFIGIKELQELLKFSKEKIGDTILNSENYNINDDIIPINGFPKYQINNKKLAKFIQIFKPELKEIELIPFENRNVYHVRKLFVYDDYKVELEFESSGIKQLVNLFTYLERCANGCISFIDEIDTNINSLYFKKLISFFKEYGKGQLIFTTHNVEAMNVLKSVSRSIVVLGNDNKIDTWVPIGNKSPINDYMSGKFPNSPMNVEDFDFINIFMGEE